MSSFDKIYRKLIKIPMFTHGWGNPDTIIKLIDTFPKISERSFMDKMIKDQKLKINKLLIPKAWPTKFRPLCFHFSGTGDHNYARRRIFLANKLLGDGIGSLIVMNPFYSDRKPKNQRGSCLNNISDLFVMGASLILETNTLLDWCEKMDFGPFALHGISMGGFMASICAQSSFRRISLVPCLSSTTASCVFVDGVMSYSVDWSTLTNQYKENSIFSETIQNKLYGVPQKFRVDRKVQDEDEILTLKEVDEIVKKVNVEENEKTAFDINQILGGWEVSKLGSTIFTPAVGWGSEVSNWLGTAIIESKIEVDPNVKKFTTDLLDTFTHLGNYPPLQDPSLVCAVLAEDDAYVPDQDVAKLTDVYPGAEIRYLPQSGHVGAYLRNTFWDENFRNAICTSLNRQVSGDPDQPFGLKRISKLKAKIILQDKSSTTDHINTGSIPLSGQEKMADDEKKI